MQKTVSYSEIYTYMKCPRKHKLSYINKLHKTTRSESKRMNLGSMVHEMLEASLKYYWVRGYDIPIEEIYSEINIYADAYVLSFRPTPETIFDGENFVEIGQDSIKEWDVDFELAKQIAKRTIKHLDIPNKWRIETIQWNGETIPLVEFKFEYPLFADRNLVGVIDLVARSLEDDQVYLIDWKTRQTLVDDFEIGQEHMSMQLSIYQYVLNALGVKVAGSVTYQIKSDVPKVPSLTLKGQMSRAKISSDYETYMNAVLSAGLDVSDYADMEFADESHWFKPVQVVRGVVELRNRWENVQAIVKQMVNDLVAPKFETPDCVYCPFFKLCYGEDIGLDNSYLIEQAYTKEI